MPRKKRTIVEETLPDETNEREQHTDVDDLIIVLSKVYKVNTNGKQSFCFQTPEPVDEVTIQERYPAGGSFIVFELNSVGEQINKQSFEIEAKPATTIAGTTTSDLQTSILMNELQFMRNMVLNMVSNRNNEATPIAEIIRAAKDMHSMGSGKDPVDLIIKGMELGQKSNGGSGDWKTELISTAKETLAPALQLLARQPQQPNGEQLMVPSNIPTPPATIVKQAIAWLKGKILMGLTPDLAVDWILQNGNDPEYQPILSLAVQGSIDNFIELEPEIANEPYRTWFTTAIQNIKDEYAEQSTNTSNLDGGNRNTPNNAGNEKSGSGKSKLKKVV